jgi:hypothetical protein
LSSTHGNPAALLHGAQRGGYQAVHFVAVAEGGPDRLAAGDGLQEVARFDDDLSL